MPAFPKLTELPTEAKSKELKAQLEADFKIAKKSGDLKRQQQQWIDISDGGEPADKIYAINRLLKSISDSIGAATLTQMLSLPEKGSGAYTAILGEGAPNGKQKAYAELLALLAKVLELTYPDFITATAAEADGPVSASRRSTSWRNSAKMPQRRSRSGKIRSTTPSRSGRHSRCRWRWGA